MTPIITNLPSWPITPIADFQVAEEAEIGEVFTLSGGNVGLMLADPVLGHVPRNGLISCATNLFSYSGPEFARQSGRKRERIVVIVAEPAKPAFEPGTKVRFHERGVRAQITRWVDDHQPGFVAIVLTPQEQLVDVHIVAPCHLRGRRSGRQRRRHDLPLQSVRPRPVPPRDPQTCTHYQTCGHFPSPSRLRRGRVAQIRSV